MKENRKFYVLLLALSTVIGGYVVIYYWMHETVEDARTLPLYVVIPVFAYVLLQMVKRHYFSRRNWWDWMYYLGLLAVVLPTFLMTKENQSIFQILTDFGTFFLIVPMLLDGKQWLNEGK